MVKKRVKIQLFLIVSREEKFSGQNDVIGIVLRFFPLREATWQRCCCVGGICGNNL